MDLKSDVDDQEYTDMYTRGKPRYGRKSSSSGYCQLDPVATIILGVQQCLVSSHHNLVNVLLDPGIDDLDAYADGTANLLLTMINNQCFDRLAQALSEP